MNICKVCGNALKRQDRHHQYHYEDGKAVITGCDQAYEAAVDALNALDEVMPIIDALMEQREIVEQVGDARMDAGEIEVERLVESARDADYRAQDLLTRYARRHRGDDQ